MLRRCLLLVTLALSAGCGGSVASSNDVPENAGAASSSDERRDTSRPCVLLAWPNGVSVSFQYTAPGAYVFDLLVDDAAIRCKARLPSPTNATTCSDPGASLGLIGPVAPSSDQSLVGIGLATTSAKAISLRAERDGRLLDERAWVVTYDVLAHPNGPGCDPTEARSAKLSFP